MKTNILVRDWTELQWQCNSTGAVLHKTASRHT